MKILKYITLVIILVFSVDLFAQTADTVKVRNKNEKKFQKSVSKTLLKAKKKPEKINVDRFIDMDGDGISDSRGRGFGLRSRLLLNHQKNSDNQKRNKGGKNGKK